MNSGEAEQWYDNLPCSQYDLASATPITIADADVTGIDFPLEPLSYHEQNDPHILYSGMWSTYSTTWASNESYMRSNTSGSSVSISFTGISLDWFATMTGSTPGKADVYVDDEYADTVDLSAFTQTYQVLAWSTGDLPRGFHTVRIAWNSSNASGSKYITLDALAIDGTIAYVPPSITSLTPTIGSTAGDTVVTINGIGFTGVSKVLFGDTEATTFTVDSSTKITATAPAHEEEGAVRVQVTAIGGTTEDVDADNFTYVVAPNRYDQTNANIVKTGAWTDYASTPSYQSSYGRSLTSGASATVWFTGTRIAWIGIKGSTPGIVDVYIDGDKEATLDLYASPAVYQTTLFTSDTLSNSLHHMDLVRNPSSLATEYLVLDAVDIWGTIKAAPPTITSIAPTTGSTEGGTTVVINGKGFEGLSGPEAVAFGGVPATDYTVNSATKITAVTPAHEADTVQVQVTTPSGATENTANDDYTYAEIVVPTITGLDPASGVGGTSVVITGAGFVGVTAVTFGGTNATSFSVTDAGHITAVAPAHAAGTVRVQVTALGGTTEDVEADNFTYVTPNRAEQSAGGLYWSGTWTSVSSASYSGSSYKYTNTSGASLTLAFYGTQFSLIAKKSPALGNASVSIDGGTPANVDLYNKTTVYKQTVYTSPTLSDGLHVVKISRAGTRNASSSGYTINVDAFDLRGSLASYVKAEQTDSRFSYRGTWATVSTTSASGSTYRQTNSVAASYSIPFSGTVELYATLRYNQGTADIYIDGVKETSVDLGSATALYKQKVATITSPDRDLHVLSVVRSPVNSANLYINLDYVIAAGSLPTATTFEQTNSKILWTGAWTAASSTSYSGGSHKYTDATGALATVDFTGVMISLVCRRSANYGIAWVRIDGEDPIPIDLYSASTLYKQTVWTSPFLSPGEHTLTIECSGTKRAAATGVRVDVDAVKVVGTLR